MVSHFPGTCWGEHVVQQREGELQHEAAWLESPPCPVSCEMVGTQCHLSASERGRPTGARNQQIVASLFSHLLLNLWLQCSALQSQIKLLLYFFPPPKALNAAAGHFFTHQYLGKRRHSSLAALFSLLVVQISLQTTNPLFCGWVL